MIMYRVTTSYFVCGIEVKNGIVWRAAPIMNWAIGKKIEFIENWVKSKGGTIETLEEALKKVP